MYTFSSFNAHFLDLIKVKSKVITNEKEAQKYGDSIPSGNISMYVSQNTDNKNSIIINFGKIPPNEELMVISELILYSVL
jgi:hypothetical protein